MSYLIPSEFTKKMVDAGESKLKMATRDVLIGLQKVEVVDVVLLADRVHLSRCALPQLDHVAAGFRARAAIGARAGDRRVVGRLAALRHLPQFRDLECVCLLYTSPSPRDRG